MVDVKDKWALITGSSRGIGKLIALYMAQHGCNLVLHSRKKSHTIELHKEVQEFGVDAYTVEAELSNHNEVVAMLDYIDAKGTGIDIVFNNAGIQVGYRQNYWNTPIEDFEKSFRINFIAATTICYHFMPKMIERGFGRVINTTSDIKNEPEQAGYSTSKAALDKYTRDLGSKLEGTNVLINLTNPGWCQTDLGGSEAPNKPESTIPGVVVGAFIDDQKSGRLFNAQGFKGMSLENAVEKAKQVKQ
jgi:short-subunit dehydrogenase